MKLLLPLAALLVLLATACGGTDNSAKDLPTPPSRKAGVLPTIQKSTAVPTAIPDAFNGDALLNNITLGNLLSALQTCSLSFGTDKDALKACVDKQMTAARTNSATMDFFHETGYWLIGFTEAGRIDMANVLATAPGSQPELAILGPGRQLQTVAELFADRFPDATKDHASPFKSDPKYAALVSGAQARSTSGTPDLRHFDDAQFEIAQQMATAPRFILQIGIANGCKTCGTGVAARYSFTFDLNGKVKESSFLGLCQGRLVTRNTGIGQVTMHEFTSPSGTATATAEPYRVVVPGLADCPQHLDF